jgi:hypothetical protein
MELTGDDARRFHKYMEDPDCTVCGLILIHEAHLLVYPDNKETKRRLEILKTRDPDEIIHVSQFKEIFDGYDVRQRYL